MSVAKDVRFDLDIREIAIDSVFAREIRDIALDIVHNCDINYDALSTNLEYLREHIPYDEALRNGDRQDAIMKKVMDRPDIESVWDSEEVEKAILAEL